VAGFAGAKVSAYVTDVVQAAVVPEPVKKIDQPAVQPETFKEKVVDTVSNIKVIGKALYHLLFKCFWLNSGLIDFFNRLRYYSGLHNR
jgi:hypothetical protein